MSETHIVIRFLWMYFPRKWEFGSALSKLRNATVPENPRVCQVVKKFPAFYETKKFIPAFTSALPLSPLWARTIQPIPHHLEDTLNIILPSTPRSSKWSLSLRLY
jgi:hypothetical protein